MKRTLRVAALAKQIPSFQEMRLDTRGRLDRSGAGSEMNAYCRRAVAKAAELASESGGSSTVLTLGPAGADDVLREAIACGIDRGLHVIGDAFAGSDTLATARALARALELTGPYDLVLTGRNSVDADTGQVGPQLAQLLGIAFIGGVRKLDIDGSGLVRARCETDDGWCTVEADLPLVISCAERLCNPAKAAPEQRRAVPANRIQVLSDVDLGTGPWGQAGSQTVVGHIRDLDQPRDRVLIDEGTPQNRAARAAALLTEAGIVGGIPVQSPSSGQVPAPVDGPRSVGVLVEPGRGAVTRELLGAAAGLAAKVGGSVVALARSSANTEHDVISSWGADEALLLDGSAVADDVASALCRWILARPPWAVLAPSTLWGREIAARLAVASGAGLTGDALELDVDGDRLIGWKPAFGGRLVAAIMCSSPVQMATVRPGVLPVPRPRSPRPLRAGAIAVPALGRVRVTGSDSEDVVDVLARAAAVVGVGTGVDRDRYGELAPLLDVLGAELAATRKVTDIGWQPRSRQIGITGRHVAPEVYVALGTSGRFNHSVGFRGARTVLAVNTDPGAPIFDIADIGVVGDWAEIVPPLVTHLEQHALARIGGA